MSEIEQLGLPGPNDEPIPEKEDQRTSGATTSQSRRYRIRSAEECLYALDQLAGVVAMGLVSTGRANAIRGLLREILAHHQRAAGGSSSAASVDGQMLERIRRDPQLMNLIEPLLTPEQIATLMGASSHGAHK